MDTILLLQNRKLTATSLSYYVKFMMMMMMRVNGPSEFQSWINVCDADMLHALANQGAGFDMLVSNTRSKLVSRTEFVQMNLSFESQKRLWPNSLARPLVRPCYINIQGRWI